MIKNGLFALAVISIGLTGVGLVAQGQSGNTGKGNSSGKGGGGGNSNENKGNENKGNENKGNGNGGQGQPEQAKNRSIEWLTDRSEVEAALADTGTAEVEFESGADLENVEVWLSPSLRGLTAEPELFEEILEGTVYVITLTLEEPPEHTLGGTLHLRNSGGNNRTYAPPFPINVKVRGGSSNGDDDGGGDDGDDVEDPELLALVASADYQGGSVTPGQTVTVFGTGLGPRTAQGPKLDSTGRVASYLGDSQVLFDGIPAPLLVSVDNQVNAVVPQGVAGQPSVEIVVTHRSGVSNTITLPVADVAPALFTLNGSGTGQSAAINQDGTINGRQHPAARGSVVSFFGSGLGEWTNAVPDGTVIGTSLPSPKALVSVTIGGLDARVLYVGGASGSVSGVVQMNVEIPAGAPSGGAEVIITADGESSRQSVTVAVQ